MANYIIIGLLCLINPLTGREECAWINESPIIYYEKNTCLIKKDKKAAEIAVGFNSKGFEITVLDLQCIVDNKNKNT